MVVFLDSCWTLLSGVLRPLRQPTHTKFPENDSAPAPSGNAHHTPPFAVDASLTWDTLPFAVDASDMGHPRKAVDVERYDLAKLVNFHVSACEGRTGLDFSSAYYKAICGSKKTGEYFLKRKANIFNDEQLHDGLALVYVCLRQSVLPR